MLNSNISTCWNSTNDMLSKAYEKKTILEKMNMFVLKFRPNEHYLISNEEWQLVSTFTNKKIKFLSRADVPADVSPRGNVYTRHVTHVRVCTSVRARAHALMCAQV